MSNMIFAILGLVMIGGLIGAGASAAIVRIRSNDDPTALDLKLMKWTVYGVGISIFALLAGCAATVVDSQTQKESTSTTASDTSPNLAGFRRLVEAGEPCQALFDYRNDLRRSDPSTADDLNTELRSVGCSSSSSERNDTAPIESSTAKHPTRSCEEAWAKSTQQTASFSTIWSVIAVDSNRRLLWRLDGTYTTVTICDITTTGEYAKPSSSIVHSIFKMNSVGAAPDEELPKEADMWEEADSVVRND